MMVLSAYELSPNERPLDHCYSDCLHQGLLSLTHPHTLTGGHTHTRKLTHKYPRTHTLTYWYASIPIPVYILLISKISDSSDGTRRPESQLPHDHPQRTSGLSAKSFHTHTHEARNQ